MGIFKGSIAMHPLNCKRELTSRLQYIQDTTRPHHNVDSHLHWRVVLKSSIVQTISYFELNPHPDKDKVTVLIVLIMSIAN